MIKLVAKPEAIKRMREEDQFIKAILLMRIAAAIRYNNIIQTKIMGDEDYSLSLHFYLIVNHAASLYEGIDKFFKLGLFLKDLKKYKENREKIKNISLQNKNKDAFIQRVLKPIRHEIAFHFNEDAIKEKLIEYLEDCIKKKNDVVLVSGSSKLIRDTTYEITDNVIINYSLDKVAGKDLPVKEKVKRFSESLVKLSESFLEVLDDLIGEIFSKYNFVVEE